MPERLSFAAFTYMGGLFSLSGAVVLVQHNSAIFLADKSLSVDAHNAKIITRQSVVTLHGPVETQAESLNTARD
jgi:hypothetical protein